MQGYGRVQIKIPGAVRDGTLPPDGTRNFYLYPYGRSATLGNFY